MKYKRNEVNKTNQIKYYLAIFISMFIFLAFFSMSSPLFYTNTWVDSNSYKTVANGILNGLVPYKDLFEQKGPVLYFIHVIANVITKHSFFGVYIMEVIAISVSLVFVFKSNKLFLADKPAFILSYLILPFLILEPYFSKGDSAEEFMFPAIFFLFYFAIKNLCSPEKTKIYEFFAVGMSFGYVFWIKYSLIGSWVGLFGVFLFFLLKEKNYAKVIIGVTWSAIGFVIFTLPILIYFFFNDALQSLIDVYFQFNMNSYPSEGKQIGMISKFVRSFLLLFQELNSNSFLLVVFISLFFVVSLNTKISTRVRASIFIMFLFQVMLAFYGGKIYPYYFLSIIPFVYFLIFSIMQNMMIKKYYSKFNKSAVIGFFISLVFFCFCNNTIIKDSILFNSQEEYYQFMFGKIIKEDISAEKTLLNYGVLDLGIYNATGILPNERFFQRQNVKYKDFPENMNAQKKVILDKKVEYVTTRTSKNEKLQDLSESVFAPKILLKNYSVISKFQEKKFTYWLLKRIDE